MLKKTAITYLERAALAAYGSKSLSYYNGYHPTSRFFDDLIDSYLQRNPLPIKPGAKWLEVGSGRGRLVRYARSGISFRRCYFDICSDHDAAFHVVGSALRMPFKDATFDGVVSFLGDAFNTREYFAEARRVLKPAGHLVHVVPSAEWGHTLRRHLGYQTDETIFVGRSGKPIRAPSLLYHVDTLERMTRRGGFREVDAHELRSRYRPLAQLPKEVRIVLSSLKIGIRRLPLLIVVRATR